jgi:peptidoglycan/LPS O-acetylase OafA/YrhL
MSIGPVSSSTGARSTKALRALPRSSGGRFGYAQSGRSLPMDMLRGIAILLVLGRHYVVAPENVGVIQPFASAWTTIGWAGVDLFFVLSGFLVSGLIFAEYRQRTKVDIRRFVIRRGFKIWPPYLVYIAIVAVWLSWLRSQGSAPAVWSELWPNVFHVQNYFHTPRVHTWSLAVEEHFYLAVALVFYWVLGRANAAVMLRRLPTFVITCLVGVAAMRHIAFLREGAENLNLYATHLRIDGLLIGTLLAYWTQFEPAKLAPLQQRPLTLMMVGALLAAPTLILSPEASQWTAGVGLTGVYVGFALFMLGWLNVANVHASWRRGFGRMPAAVLGQIGFYSYSIYLWHVDLAQSPIKKLAEAVTAADISPALVWAFATTVYVIVAVLTGVLLARLLEIPSLALRDRLFPSVVKPVAISALPEAAQTAVGATRVAALPDAGARAGAR